MRKLFLALVALVSAPAAAEGVELWGGIYAGANSATVVAKYPKFNVVLTERCKANITFEMGKDRSIQSVRLYMTGMAVDDSCGPTVLASLKAKYGNPIEVQPPTDRGNGTSYATYRLMKEAVLVTLNMRVGNPNSGSPYGEWNVVYEPQAAAESMASKL